ncbi:MAG: replication initiation protein [Kiritimatiellae bacterium]|nr:replication initiation protein [Kiritimatiellia bacterium]
MGSIEPIFYDKDLMVVQANELVRSKKDDLTLIEAKLIRLAIGQILKEDTDLRTYSCEIVDLARFLGISSDNIYRDVADINKSLMGKVIYIEDPTQRDRRGNPRYKLFHWVDVAEYADGVITYKISEELKPYLIGLERFFTKYGYESIAALPSDYAIRLYELLASYQNLTVKKKRENDFGVEIEKNEIVFEIKWLRTYFGCEKKYSSTGDFIKWIIDGSVSAIQQHTDMRLTYRTVKSGRYIKYVVFKIHAWYDSGYEEVLKQLKAGERAQYRLKGEPLPELSATMPPETNAAHNVPVWLTDDTEE